MIPDSSARDQEENPNSGSADLVLATASNLLLIILVLCLVGTIAELLLLRHMGSGWEYIPIVIVGLSFPALAWNLASKSVASRLLMKLLMAASLASGILGTWLHFNANVGYERESNPGLGLVEVYKLALGGSTPTLAPGMMIQLALVGFVFLFLQSYSNRGTGSAPRKSKP